MGRLPTKVMMKQKGGLRQRQNGMIFMHKMMLNISLVKFVLLRGNTLKQ